MAPDGPERAGYTPTRRAATAFGFWAVGNCTHDYWHSLYYRDSPQPLYWEGYDAHVQARLACDYIRATAETGLTACSFPDRRTILMIGCRMCTCASINPICCLSRPMYPSPIDRRAGYYAHISALDDALGWILAAIRDSGQEQDTIVVFTRPRRHARFAWRVAQTVALMTACWCRWYCAIRQPRARRRTVDAPVNVVDLLPTLLSLSGMAIPDRIEGSNGTPGDRRSQRRLIQLLMQIIHPLLNRSSPNGAGANRPLHLCPHAAWSLAAV